MGIAANVAGIRERIQRARERRDRDSGEVTLVGVTKSVDADTALALVDAGVLDLGENRLPEFGDKAAALTRKCPAAGVRLHFIGHLQRNKVSGLLATGALHLLQSLDSERLARTLQEKAQVSEISVDTLLEVKTSPEETKHGLEPDGLLFLSRMISVECPNLRVRGLMTMAPFTGDRKAIRSSFDLAWDLWCELRRQSLPRVEMQWLSMGMSDDFELAVEAGSNMVRVGRALFA